MADAENPFKSVQKEALFFKTAIGAIEWWPNWDVMEEHLFKPLREAAEVADAQSAHNEAMVTVRLYFMHFFMTNIQHAAAQAVEELIALAKAKAARDRHEREQIAQAAAEIAKWASLERLRATNYFTKPKRGDKKRPSTDQWIHQFLNEQSLFVARLETAITTLLKNKKGKRLTLDNVAALMWIGSKGTGGKILGRQLKKWIDPHEAPKRILDNLVEQIKTGLSAGD